MISIIRYKKDVTKAQLWEAYRDMVENYEDSLGRLSDAIEARAHCPSCGMPTVPDHQGLHDEDKTCERCAS